MQTQRRTISNHLSALTVGAVGALFVLACIAGVRWAATLKWVEAHPGLASWAQAVGTLLAVAAAVALSASERRHRTQERAREADDLVANARLVVRAANDFLLQLDGVLNAELFDTGTIDLSREIRMLPRHRTGVRHYLERPLPNAHIVAELLDCLSDLQELQRPLMELQKPEEAGGRGRSAAWSEAAEIAAAAAERARSSIV